MEYIPPLALKGGTTNNRPEAYSPQENFTSR
jgi:hypothetical protein